MAELGFRDEQGEEIDRKLEDGIKNDEELKPWDQHSAIISIPRYDYKAPSSLLERPHSGFLITCPIKREKSATKEAISILEEHMNFGRINVSEGIEAFSTNLSAKRMRTCPRGAENLNQLEKKTDLNLNELSNLSLVKLRRSGLLLLTSSSLNYCHVVDTLSSLFHALDSRSRKPPKWCHRIFPIQETCPLTEMGLQEAVTNIVTCHYSSQPEAPDRPIKFAVGYNRRGIEETEMKNQKNESGVTVLERNKCFSAVAGAFKNVVHNSIVDLKSPEVVIFVELLPLSGIPLQSLIAGVSILPRVFVDTKPRLSVKPLIINTQSCN